MELLISLLGAACIAVLWVNAEPTIYLRELIFKEKQNWFRRLLECAMCTGFWVGLILTTNVYEAAIISIVAEFISRQLNKGSLL